MLKSKTTKIIIGAIVVLCVLAASSIWVFSSMKSNSVEEFGYSSLAATGSDVATKTQIDHIIENSMPVACTTCNGTGTVEEATCTTCNGTGTVDSEDPFYHVYIINNGVTATSPLTGDFFSNDEKFSKWVINNNRTITESLPNGKIDMHAVSVIDLNGMDKDGIAATLGNADLIYLESSSDVAYTGASAISEDLYEYLHNYAFGSNKPLMISYPQIKGDDGNDDDDTPSVSATKMSDMTESDFKYSWRWSNTTKVRGWTESVATDAVADTLKQYIQSRTSLYVRYRINNSTLPTAYRTLGWSEYWKRSNEETETDGKLNILYIHGNTMLDKSPIQEVGDWMVGEGRSYAFTALDQDLPTRALVTPIKAGDLTVNDLYVTNTDPETGAETPTNIKKYDYIFIAPDDYTGDADIKDEVRTELNTLSEASSADGLTYILFGELPEAGTSGGTGGNSGSNTGETTNLTIDTTTNFGKLLDLSVTTTGYAKKNNILVIGSQFVDKLSEAPEKNPTKISKIVSLINKSRYREHAGSGNGGTSGSTSTTAYRVLELQPCYPIDKLLASTIDFVQDRSYLNTVVKDNNKGQPPGNYYTTPANVLNTSEIDDFMVEDDQGNRRMTQEYYQWDLSKAKLAYALGMKADQIELVQMSTDEYITAKADASDSYDLIYVGGNMSAFKNNLAYSFAVQSETIRPEHKNYSSAFSMYCHTGEMTEVKGTVSLVGAGDYTFVGGNDITYDRLTQLEAYIDAGMPIVFSNEIWNAYELAVKDGYKNRYMDPDCNMYKLCAYAEEAAKTKSSVLPDWQNRKEYESNDLFFTDYYVASDEQTVENPDGTYGSAANVTVYGAELNDQLWVCANSGSVRPKFTINTTALTYVESDSSTELKNRDVSWTVELLNPVEGHTYEAVLLQDQDDNAVFAADEQLGTAATFGADNKAQLSYTYPENDFGAFSWKILVRDTTTKASTGYSAITCFAKLEDQPKKQASILEIMPMMQSHCASVNPSSPDGHTFYLDKNYQQSSGNPYLYSTYGTAKGDEFGYCPILHSPGNGSDAVSFNSNLIARATKDGNYQSISDANMGKYMTTLSVNRYDSGEGHEDRDYNYMDLVSDEYDFSLDIMYMDDIIYYSKVAHDSSITDEQRNGYAKEAKEAKELYDAYNTEGTPEYERLKKVEDALREALISIRNGNDYTGIVRQTQSQWDPEQGKNVDVDVDVPYTVANNRFKTYGIDQMLQSRDYFRFFYLNTDMYHGSNYANPAYVVYASVYKPYIEEHDKMVDAYRKYRHYNMMAYGPKDYLRKNYDVIVVGFFDDYAGGFQDFSDVETEDLLAFTNYKTVENGKTYEDGGSLLMTHDNMSARTGDGHPEEFANQMRSVMGMEPFANLKEVTGTGTTGYAKYSSTNFDKYFLTNLSSNSGINLSKDSLLQGNAWDSAYTSWADGAGRTSGKKVNLLGYTDAFTIFGSNGYGLTERYVYAEIEMQEAIKYNMQITGPLINTGTAKATQVNRGVVTTYPFYIASDLRISNTHSQAYALDMEDSAVTVWYTLAADSTSAAGTAGGNNHALMKKNSSLYAASPHDGADSYYIYSVGNITYCGAGHALITGDQRDNNDERRLFLNVLINMAKRTRKEQKEADIILYDPDGTTKAPGNVVKRDAENGYHIDVTSGISYPEFGFQLDMKNGQSAKDVKIFYDLDYTASMENPDAYIANENHVLVPLPDTASIIEDLNAKKVRVLTKLNYPGLATKREYFDKYGGKYTYLVISVTLNDDTVVTKRIKIMLTKELLDLT